MYMCLFMFICVSVTGRKAIEVKPAGGLGLGSGSGSGSGSGLRSGLRSGLKLGPGLRSGLGD